MVRKSTVIICALVAMALFAVSSFAAMNRYKIVNKPWGYVRFDRWTGKAVGCGVNGCVEYADAADPSKRTITVTFADGSQHIYTNAPDDAKREQVITRAEKDTGKRVADVCCLADDAISDAQIADYLAKKATFNIVGARQSGYSDREIIKHLIQKNR